MGFLEGLVLVLIFLLVGFFLGYRKGYDVASEAIYKQLEERESELRVAAEDHTSPIGRAKVYIRYGRFDDAINCLQSVLDEEPSHLQAEQLMMVAVRGIESGH